MKDPGAQVLGQSPNAIASHLVLRAHLRDGMPEIVVGLMFLLAAAFNLMSVNLARASMAMKAALFADICLFMVLSVSASWLLKWVRGRFLIEREGYVEHKSAKRKVTHILLVAIAISVLLAATALWIKPPRLDRWILAAFGLYVGAVWTFMGQTRRFKIAGALNASTGILLSFTALSMQICLAIFFGFSGLISLFSGLVVFVCFVRLPIETGH